MGDRERVIIRCAACASTYTGWVWPEKPPTIVGNDHCPECESDEFVVVDGDRIKAGD